ncbi:protein of unknown function (plasmid) [Cupriavidus taiwanensis]|uniref:Uncharacterized protein n=1 Tax=Cupriavidus taiwanensis TaxID=164546 RepID=A0A9Q7XT90_9BURK|nr:protein of unknown function [Cupriavidus taiwanensis]
MHDGGPGADSGWHDLTAASLGGRRLAVAGRAHRRPLAVIIRLLPCLARQGWRAPPFEGAT